MGSPDSVSATMLLNSLIPAVCLLLVSNSHSLGLQGLKEQRAREGKKQVGLPCKTIVTEQCETEYVNECAANKTNNKREKRGVLQAVLLTSAIASQNEGTTTEASAKVRCYHSPTTTCRHNHDGTIDGECRTTYTRHCYRARRSAEEDCAQVPAKHCSLTPGAEEGVDAVKVCRQVKLAKVEKVCAKVESLVC